MDQRKRGESGVLDLKGNGEELLKREGWSWSPMAWCRAEPSPKPPPPPQEER